MEVDTLAKSKAIALINGNEHTATALHSSRVRVHRPQAPSSTRGAYFMKAVTYRANFEDANLSDVLMDRAVMNEANLKNANLSRAISTRSDLTGANVEGADFTNALVDKTQQLALCKYADGINPVTGVSTRKSLGCGSMRRFKASSPSSPDGPQVPEDEKEAFRASLPVYRQ